MERLGELLKLWVTNVLLHTPFQRKGALAYGLLIGIVLVLKVEGIGIPNPDQGLILPKPLEAKNCFGKLSSPKEISCFLAPVFFPRFTSVRFRLLARMQTDEWR